MIKTISNFFAAWEDAKQISKNIFTSKNFPEKVF